MCGVAIILLVYVLIGAFTAGLACFYGCDTELTCFLGIVWPISLIFGLAYIFYIMGREIVNLFKKWSHS